MEMRMKKYKKHIPLYTNYGTAKVFLDEGEYTKQQLLEILKWFDTTD